MQEIEVINNNDIVKNNSFKANLFERYIEYLDASEKTIETYTKALRQFARYLAEHNINMPTREDILSFREELLKEHKPTTVQTYMVAVRLFFQWTDQEGLYKNVAVHIKGAKVSKAHKRDNLTSKQVKNILDDIRQQDKAQTLRDYAMFLLAVTGGLRTIEINRANIEDLRTKGDSTVLYIQGKGKDDKNDYIELIPAAEKAIREYLRDRASQDKKEPLFVSISNKSRGSRLTTKSISRIIKGHMIQAGYDSERLTAHSLRHTAVTLSLQAGYEAREVQQFARHANVNTTLIYAHDLERANIHCERAIAKAIFNDEE